MASMVSQFVCRSLIARHSVDVSRISGNAGKQLQAAAIPDACGAITVAGACQRRLCSRLMRTELGCNFVILEWFEKGEAFGKGMLSSCPKLLVIVVLRWIMGMNFLSWAPSVMQQCRSPLRGPSCSCYLRECPSARPLHHAVLQKPLYRRQLHAAHLAEMPLRCIQNPLYQKCSSPFLLAVPLASMCHQCKTCTLKPTSVSSSLCRPQRDHARHSQAKERLALSNQDLVVA